MLIYGGTVKHTFPNNDVPNLLLDPFQRNRVRSQMFEIITGFHAQYLWLAIKGKMYAMIDLQFL